MHSEPKATRRDMLRSLVACGLTASAIARARLVHANDLRVGQKAPTAVLQTLDGERISTADLLGRVVILTFWATWCGPCRTELPLVSSFASEHADQGLTVLGFSLDEPDAAQDVRKAAQGLRFPVGLLARSSAPGYGRIWRIPVNFTIDRAGVLVDDGWRDKTPVWTAERLERIVMPLLHTDPAAAHS